MRQILRLTLCLFFAWRLHGADDDSRGDISDDRPRGEAGYFYRTIGRPAARWQRLSEAELEKAAPREAEAYLALARRDLEAHPIRFDQARRRVEKAAELGLAHGQYLMGYLTANQWPAGDDGGEITGDYESARDWYEKAAAQKHLKAMLELGEFHYTGRLGEHDIAQAEKWYRQAADLGSAKAMRELGELFKIYTPEKNTEVAPQPEKSTHWFRLAAEKGDADAQFELAQAYHRGFGVAKNATEARRWLRKTAEAGHDMAGLVLAGQLPFPDVGELQSDPVDSSGKAGAGNPAVDRPSEYDLIAAGNRGNHAARLKLGQMYETGQGAERNVEKALGEYAMSVGSLSVEAPTPTGIAAMESIIRIYARGELMPAPATTRAPLPDDPTRVPNAPARLQLAELFWTGNAVVGADRTNAVRWYLEAARAGSATAMRRIGQLWAEGVNGQLDPDEARLWVRRAEAIEKNAPPLARPPQNTATPTP
jgi:TPR repeat protein